MKTSSLKNQKGATLFTALVFLSLMTIVSVSAAKISMIDVLVSGNNQQEMELYQKTARELDDHTSSNKLLKLLLDESTELDKKWTETASPDLTNPHVTETIVNRVHEYGCGAIGGLATSQGSENKCRLFDFEILSEKDSTSVKERHLRGGGFEVPPISRNNFNN